MHGVMILRAMFKAWMSDSSVLQTKNLSRKGNV